MEIHPAHRVRQGLTVRRWSPADELDEKHRLADCIIRPRQAQHVQLA